MITFTAMIEKAPKVDGAYVEVPFDPQKVFGVKRVKVKATFDGVAYRGSITPMGGRPLIGITKAIRNEIGKQAGDSVEVTIEQDTEERVIELAKDAETALIDANLLEAWKKQSYSHQREHMMWINEAKKPETRQRRIVKMIELLKK
ncbi:MAG: YdeI/OmpD-associated family protein [Eggerthellaceae bacterium]|nr:YdeI/OmpD-associated family protein [Eggerthellaceae bacterium]